MRILIIEDEMRIAKRIERMARRNFGDLLQSIHHEEHLDSALMYLKDNSVIDLVFLDLNLNGLDGFKVLEEMVAANFQTIIISAYKEKAIKAFEYGVLDFIPKPFDESRFINALSRFSTKEKSLRSTKYLAVKKRDKHQLFQLSDIDFIQGAGNYSELVFPNGNRELHAKTLDSLQLILPEVFIRVHRSYIASLNNVKSLMVEPGSKYSLVLKSGNIIPVGRTKYKLLKEKIDS